jgi:hypothetical protein
MYFILQEVFAKVKLQIEHVFLIVLFLGGESAGHWTWGRGFFILFLRGPWGLYFVYKSLLTEHHGAVGCLIAMAQRRIRFRYSWCTWYKPLKMNYTPFHKHHTVHDSADWFVLAESGALAIVCADFWSFTMWTKLARTKNFPWLRRIVMWTHIYVCPTN